MQLLAHAYYFSFLFYLDICLGAMLVLLIHRLTGGRWGELVSLPLRSTVATLPLLALLMLPLWFLLDPLFPWAGADRGTQDFNAAQGFWLQAWLQILRSLLYFLVWFAVAALILGWGPFRRLRTKISTGATALALVVLVVVTSFFAVDWLLSLVVESTSTMIGFLLMAEQVAAALALSVCCCSFQKSFDGGDGIDLGNLLLATVMFYGYCLYMDYLIVWEGNLPREIAWYSRRGGALSSAVAALIVLLHIAAPVFLLFFRRIKSSGPGLTGVAALVLLGHFFQSWWYVMSLLPSLGPMDALVTVAVFAGMSMLWLSAFRLAAGRYAVFHRWREGEASHGEAH